MSKWKKDAYSPISVINSEQMMIAGYCWHTAFSNEMYKKIRDSSYEKKYYDWDKFWDKYHSRYQWEKEIASYILLKSYYKNSNGLEDFCLSSRVPEDWEARKSAKDYRKRYIGKQYGIVPTIPYKYVSKIAKMYRESSFRNYNFYALGHYPCQKIDFTHTWWYVDLVDELHCIGKQKLEHLPGKSEFHIIDEQFSFPTIIDDKLELETYNVYQAKTYEGTEIKAIKYNDELFQIEPVLWKKIGDDLVCTNILFESPVHMKNDFVQNCDIQSLNDTFLKWYIDNVFVQDLFKYTDLSFMKDQMPLGIDEEIDSKLKEIERLKQLKANLILQQRSEEHIIDTAHGNITRLFEEDTKESVVKTLHK